MMEIKTDIVYADFFDEIYPYIEPYREICLVLDSNLRYDGGKIAEMVSRLDADGRLKCLYEFEASEANKTLASVEKLIGEMVSAELGRNVLVIAVGGGITTDLAGFAASVYKRGVRFVFVPTTLLAQSDASIGGKTGVNFDGYKNMVGVFRSPEFTFICPDVLKTLSWRQIVSGAAEILKTFIIADDDAYSHAVRLLSTRKSLMANGEVAEESFWGEMASLSARAAAIKAEIVAKDPYENGLRRVLNLGHTFGHAIEALSAVQRIDITHGEAVAMGIILSARLGAGLGQEVVPDGCESGKALVERLEADFTAAGLPVQSPFTLYELAPYMSKDKKAESGSVHFVIPESIGHCVVREMSVQEAVDAVCRYDSDL